ncbi:MAG: hypothetical protein LUE98_19385 [Tannerellaceae bacterium]|nr:hypothetical protein [Tannerellaceae bacterium]
MTKYKEIILLLFFLLPLLMYGQSDTLFFDFPERLQTVEEDISQLTTRQRQHQTELRSLRMELNAIRSQITITDSILHLERRENKTALKEVNNKMIQQDGKLNQKSEQLQQEIRDKTQKAIIIGLLCILIFMLIYFLLRRRVVRESDSIRRIHDAQQTLQTTQLALQEESVKLDTKLVEIFRNQLEQEQSEHKNTTHDHLLALKIADEIVRIETNLLRMEPTVKGYKQLSASVRRIKENFTANGYEIVEMLGTPYHEGMKVVANFLSDESLAEGEQLITGIQKPQVNYNGVMIQSAEITVSQH